jgi:iron complex transport system substrate-binding protein
MTLRLLAILFVSLALPAQAQETRSYTDDVGVTATVPAAPQRIVALHDIYLTVPLLELGVLPVGSGGRVNDDGSTFIRSSEILTGVDFDTSDIVFVGSPPDPEVIAGLAPDLILSTTLLADEVPDLSAIAPVLTFDVEARGLDGIYAALADLTGTGDRLAQLQAAYAAQIAQLREIVDTGTITVSTVHADPDEIWASNPYGMLGRVLDDAGFAKPALIAEIPPNGSASFSAEALADLDADVIVTTYRQSAGETPAAVRGYFEGYLPGFCDFLHACRSGQMFFLSREQVLTNSFAARGQVAYALLALIGSKEIMQQPE